MCNIKILGNALINEASLLFTVNSDNLPITGNHNNSDDLPMPGNYDMGLPIPGQIMDLPLPGERNAREL